MRKNRFVLLVLCLLLGFSACGSPASQISDQSPASSEVSQEPEENATGYSLEQIGLKIVFPEKVDAYPFGDNFPYMYAESGVRSAGPFGLRDRFRERYPSLKAAVIDFNGGWTIAGFWWNQPGGVRFEIPAMLLQAFKKSDIDNGMKVEYLSYMRNDLCVELSKEELTPYLWKETDEYYIIDFLDIYISDYRVFACEAALYDLDTAEYLLDLNEKNLDFNTFLGKVNDVRDELKDKITLE